MYAQPAALHGAAWRHVIGSAWRAALRGAGEMPRGVRRDIWQRRASETALKLFFFDRPPPPQQMPRHR